MSPRWEETYRGLIRTVIEQGQVVSPHRGQTRELVGHKFVLENPRDRLLMNEARMFNVWQAMGHWLWIMAGKMDLPSIHYYNKRVGNMSVDQRKLGGAYGPRLFGIGVFNQIPNAIEVIQSRGRPTRRAVATVYVPEFDTYRKKVADKEDEVPCTVALQFLARNDRLHAVVMMRSQEVQNVLPYDVFVFTLIQEYVASSLEMEVGEYHHFASSFHIYEDGLDQARRVLADVTPAGVVMPPMPSGSQEEHLKTIFELEEAIRNVARAHLTAPGASRFRPKAFIDRAEELPDFWRNAALCLVLWAAVQLRDLNTIRLLRDKLSPSLRIYADRALVIASPARSLDRFSP